MRSHSLPLRTLLRSLVLAAGPFGVACSSSIEPTPMSETISCEPLDEKRYAGITPAPGIDGISFFTLGQQTATFSAPGSGSAALASFGAPCRSARDHAACLAQVAAVVSTGGWQVYGGNRNGWSGPDQIFADYAVVTTGDEVRLITTAEELRAAIAPLEGLDEALAFARANGVNFTCGQPNARVEADGFYFQSLSSSCSGERGEHLTKISRDGGITTTDRQLRAPDSNCTEGRRPAGLTSRNAPWLASLPAHFAEIAHMEAAAVIAFADLERDLARVNAPASLRERVARGRRDEIDHAARTSALARRFGAEPARPEVVITAERMPSVLELAIENATEGCVRETYGALIATHQATYAADAQARVAFAQIALDETEHAQLSFELGEWLRSMLSPAEIALVQRAQDAAWDELAIACNVEPAASVVIEAGMPTAASARQLLAGLRVSTPRFGEPVLRAA